MVRKRQSFTLNVKFLKYEVFKALFVMFMLPCFISTEIHAITLHGDVAKGSIEIQDDVRSVELRNPNYFDLLTWPSQMSHAHDAVIRNEEFISDVRGVFQNVADLQNTLLSDSLLHGEEGISMGNDWEDLIITQLFHTTLESFNEAAGGNASHQRCVNDTGHLITSLFNKETWALKFLDAAGKPGPGLTELRVNFVGDYDLCRSLVAPPGNFSDGFKGNYVNLKVSLGKPDPKNIFKTLVIQWGVCMPDTCSDVELTAYVDEAIQLLNKSSEFYTLPAESRNDKTEVTTATVLAIIVSCVIGCLLIVATLYDIICIQWPKWQIEWAEEMERQKQINTGFHHTQGAGDDDDETLLLKDEVVLAPGPEIGKLAQVLLSFSVYTNGSKLLNTNQSEGSITCLHGIRFFSMSWVVLGHTYTGIIPYADNGATEFPKLLRRRSFDTISNASVSVDTFFTMSGFLVAYLTLKEMKKSGWKLNWGLFYFHRYWRLTPPYMLGILLTLGLQQYMGQGPLWSPLQPYDKKFCEDSWWTNLLYVNNLVHPVKMCFGHTWYLANDMQFYILSPLMIIPLYFNRLFGFASCGIFLLTSWITTGILSTHNHWSPSLLFAFVGNYFKDYYAAPWCRIGPYVIGILAGYLVASRPNVTMSKVTALVGWVAATAIALAVLYGIHGDIDGEHPSPVAVASLYNTLSRSAWAASVCWVILACCAGWGGPVNTFLSWSPFVVLSRLTYITYLFHISIIMIYAGNMQALFHLTDANMAVVYIGLLVVSYSCAFILSLALESPMVCLEKVLLPKRRKD